MKSLFYLFVTTVLFSIPVSCGKSPGNKVANEYYKKAGDFYSQNKLDSALLMFTMYVNLTNDTLTKGSVYRYMGDMVWEVGDVYAAEEYATGTIRTLDSLKTTHHSELGYAYQLLGNVHLDLKHYDEAEKMFSKAVDFSTNTKDEINAMNSKALTLQKKGAYNNAILIYDSMLLLKLNDPSLVAMIVDNRAKTRWLQNNDYNALPEFWQAMKTRTDSQYIRGLNASYAHLSDYYVKSNPDSALWYANKMLKQAQIIQTPDDKLEAIDKIIRLDNPSSAKQWYNEYKRLNDSVQLARDTTRSRFALIRYDSQKSKADYLELKEYATLQKMTMYGLIVLAILVISALWNRYNKRRKRIQQEAEIAIRDSKLKTSQKVHDVVANELYGIMNQLEHGKEIEKEPLLNRIEELYERSRDISYEDVDNTKGEGYDLQVHSLLNSFTSDRTNVYVVGNQPEFWQRVTGFQKSELLLVLREIMTNMKKHSGAGNVVVKFQLENNRVCINYSDNGKGFSPDIAWGNGLNNTVNRIKSLNGEINFGKSDKGGASIAISLPPEPHTL